MSWIVVRNWERFQHPDVLRSQGEPPWIKMYTRLLHNPDFDALTDLERGLLLTIWLEFGASDGQVWVNAGSGSGQHRVRSGSGLGQKRVRMRNLESLVQAGFITLSASRPPKTSASLEKRREEKRTPTPSGLASKSSSNGREEQIPANPYGFHGTTPQLEAAKRWVKNGLLQQVPEELRQWTLMDEFHITEEEAKTLVTSASPAKIPDE